jgi:hypothetical protein
VRSGKILQLKNLGFRPRGHWVARYTRGIEMKNSNEFAGSGGEARRAIRKYTDLRKLASAITQNRPIAIT